MKRFKTLIFIILLTLVLLPVKVFAEVKPATFTLSSPGTAKIGQTIEVSLTYTEDPEGVNNLSGSSLNITFDTNVLEYVSTSIKDGSINSGTIGVSSTGTVTLKDKRVPSSK